LRTALPVTGRRPRPEPHPFRERTNYSPDEERSLLLEGIAHLPDRTGYLWLKTRCSEAIKIETQTIDLPEGDEFRRSVDALRAEPKLGGRISRSDYERAIVERDRAWLDLNDEQADLAGGFEKKYREERAAWQV